MSFTQIELSRFGSREHVVVVTLSRPDKMNALTKVMESELREAFAQLDRDDSVRAIVLT